MGSSRRCGCCGGTLLRGSIVKLRHQRRKLTSVAMIRLNVAACLSSMVVLHRNVWAPNGAGDFVQKMSAWCKRNAKDASWSTCGKWLLSFAPICYTSNMSQPNVLQGAQNVVITDSNIHVADSVSKAPWRVLSHNQLVIFCTDQIFH